MVEAGLSATSLILALFCIVLPLAVYLWVRTPDAVRVALPCLAITALWFFSQGFIHAASHVLGNLVSGAPVTSLRVIPDSWTGFFSPGLQAPGLSGTMWQKLIWLAAPYWADAALMMLGSWLFRWRHAFPPFVGGLVLTFTYSRSVFDLLHNYVAGALWDSGDFQQLLSSYPPAAVHVSALLLIAMGAFGIYLEIERARLWKR